jgi:glycosyltransferase involved in cell wall biosynthesis
MRVLFIDIHAASGDAISTGTDSFASALVHRGHRVAVMTLGDASTHLLHRTAATLAPIGGLGYPAWRVGDARLAQWAAGRLMRRLRPDVRVVIGADVVADDSTRRLITRACHVPWVLCVRGAEDRELVDAMPDAPDLVIAASTKAADFEAALLTVTEPHRASRQQRGLSTTATASRATTAGPEASPPDRERLPEPTLATVVIPVRNVAATIDAQLAALAAQSYEGRWEVVVVDNDSTDDTRARVAAWAGRVPGLRIVEARQRRGVAHARNVGFREAHGDVVLICDGDDEVTPNWLRSMVDALRHHDLVTGALDRRALNRPEQYEWGGDVDPDDAEVGYGFLRYASGGNLGIRRDVARILAGFDESMRGGEDIDFSWRGHYAGYRVHFVRDGVIRYRLRPGLRALLVARFRIGRVEPLIYRRHRRRGMRRASATEVIDTYKWLLRTAPRLVGDPSVRYRWVAAVAQRSGRVVGSLRHRALFL